MLVLQWAVVVQRILLTNAPGLRFLRFLVKGGGFVFLVAV